MLFIHTIVRRAENSAKALMALGLPGEILAADFYLSGAEEWTPVPGGLAHPRHPIVNVDHHARLPSMQRRVSSTNLALTRLEAGLASGHETSSVVINHMDCDSVLAAGVLSGRLEPDPAYGYSALVADHTGEEDSISDLLQGLDAHWSRSGRPMPDPDGLEMFFDSLARLEASRPLDPFAQEALARRAASRDRASQMVAEGRFESEAGVYFARIEEPLEGELLLPFLEEATIVSTVRRHPEDPDRWHVKVRLGLAALEGMSLQALGIQRFDPAYGGRWNAGSNNRGGGTSLQPDDYRQRLVRAVAEFRAGARAEDDAS